MALTLQLTGAAGILSLAIGMLLALLRLSGGRPLRLIVILYVGLFRGTPLLLQILFFYFALPALAPIRMEAMTAGVVALSLNAGAYLAEIFRAAIESIDRGQMEAARSLGMGQGLAMRLVILPQTVRRLIPPVVNELASLAKDTSLVSVIAVGELLFVTQRLGAKYLRPWEVYAWSAVGYLLIVLLLSSLAARLESRLAKKG